MYVYMININLYSFYKERHTLLYSAPSLNHKDCCFHVSNNIFVSRSRLSAQIEKIPPKDSFHASKRGWFRFSLV